MLETNHPGSSSRAAFIGTLAGTRRYRHVNLRYYCYGMRPDPKLNLP